MKPKNILLLVVLGVVIAAVTYTLTATESPEDYIERIEDERERQYKFIRFNIDSPLSDEQKRNFKSLNFYPIDPDYKVMARIIPIENKKVRELPMTDGSTERYIEFAYAEFVLNNIPLRLLLLQDVSEVDKKNFFVAFADETSARETYGGGRYINARQSGKNSITIDFNLAYNPYCAYNPDYACPIPPRENILNVPIPVGEKNYKN